MLTILTTGLGDNHTEKGSVKWAKLTARNAVGVWRHVIITNKSGPPIRFVHIRTKPAKARSLFLFFRRWSDFEDLKRSEERKLPSHYVHATAIGVTRRIITAKLSLSKLNSQNTSTSFSTSWLHLAQGTQKWEKAGDLLVRVQIIHSDLG